MTSDNSTVFLVQLVCVYSQNKMVCDSFSITGMGHHDQ